jgi:hypothetical protein
VSLTIDHDAPQVMEITGLSMAARATGARSGRGRESPSHVAAEVSGAGQPAGPDPTADQVRIFRVTPTVISVLDYTKGFGHTDLVTR